ASKTEDAAQWIVALEVRRLLRQQNRENRPQGIQHGRAGLVHQRPEAGGAEYLGEGNGAARLQSSHHGAPRVTMEQRSDRQDRIVASNTQGLEKMAPGGASAAVAEERSLRVACGARGVWQRRAIARAHRDRRRIDQWIERDGVSSAAEACNQARGRPAQLR